MFENEILSQKEKIFRLRKLFNMTQSEFGGEVFSRAYISMLERGVNKLSWSSGERLLERCKVIAKEKNIYFNITLNELMESKETQRRRIYNEKLQIALRRINHNFDKKNLEMLEEALDYVEDDLAINTIIKILEFLKNKIYLENNAELFLKFSFKLNRYNLDDITYAKKTLDLAAVYVVLEDYTKAIFTASTVKKYLNELDNDYKLKYYFNTANAHYYLKEYNHSLKLLCEAEKVDRFNRYYFYISSLKSNIYTMEKDFKNAIKVNEKIIIRAQELNEIDYVANSKSNIAYMLIEMGEIEKATKYLGEAMQLYSRINSGRYKLNVLSNFFYLQEKLDNIDPCLFEKIIELALEVNNKNKINEEVEQIVNYYIRINSNTENFVSLLLFLNKKGIDIKSDLKLKISQYFVQRNKNPMKILAL